MIRKVLDHRKMNFAQAHQKWRCATLLVSVQEQSIDLCLWMYETTYQ